eukprot:CAMPEP_0117553896 /NCGR_PEP_ID=MMETSP0784-20121206/50467_1 /TAXON_ID=39447 /ORGANISM="" /LENGTH=41 /DNA_ID= /DNA_START= /DNA_END= /DNA_ORIENTATION=
MPRCGIVDERGRLGSVGLPGVSTSGRLDGSGPRTQQRGVLN